MYQDSFCIYILQFYKYGSTFLLNAKSESTYCYKLNHSLDKHKVFQSDGCEHEPEKI